MISVVCLFYFQKKICKGFSHVSVQFNSVFFLKKGIKKCKCKQQILLIYFPERRNCTNDNATSVELLRIWRTYIEPYDEGCSMSRGSSPENDVDNK